MGKLGSSRRKGDDFQDLAALQFALEYYIANKPFQMYLEYERSGNLDDIVIFDDDQMIGNQVKYAVHAFDVYEASHFLDPKSPVFLKKFADSWKMLSERFPEQPIKVRLCSNRALDASLVNCIEEDGTFRQVFIEDRIRGDLKRLRLEMREASGLLEDDFRQLLCSFQFLLRLPQIKELSDYIRIVQLDRELGLSGDAVFYDFLQAIKTYAIESREPITLKVIEEIILRTQNTLLLPQVFPVQQDHYMEPETLGRRLDNALSKVADGYVIVTGPPGSGKSTSLTEYIRNLSDEKFEVISYYCFVGVHDNAQRSRVKAESLRSNLLHELQRRYRGILRRRYDYSEGNFNECVQAIAKHVSSRGRRFLLFLDGLDHAERLESEIRDTVISALPAEVPAGMIILIGSQELHKWPYFLRLIRNHADRHVAMPLFTPRETESYLVERRGINWLTHPQIVEIQSQSQGLPLYLSYVAERILAGESTSDIVASLYPAVEGNIVRYYHFIWEEFERVGMGNARHLCAVMACLRFYIHREELMAISGLQRADFEDAFKTMSHLLRNSDDRLSVFHNSFKEFIIEQLPEDWTTEVRKSIFSYLKEKINTPRWFGHVFAYAQEVGQWHYIIEEVNADFIERSLQHCRPSREIDETLNTAIESAYQLQDIVALSRLGALKFRTSERLQENLNRTLLAETLLAQGREQDLMSFAYSSEADRWLVNRETALKVMYYMAETNRIERGKQLFEVFTSEFDGSFSDGRQKKHQVIEIAKCLALYTSNHGRAVSWLSQFDFTPDVLERKDLFSPGYAPHLEAYIDSLVKFDQRNRLFSILRVKMLFPNALVCYYVMRVAAFYNRLDFLKIALAQYLEHNSENSNVELASFAAIAGYPPAEVTKLAGTIDAPELSQIDRISSGDPVLYKYFYSAVVVAYEGNYKQIAKGYLINKEQNDTFWGAIVSHVHQAGYAVGLLLRDKESEWFQVAKECLVSLIGAKRGVTERTIEAIDLIREILPLTIGILTEKVTGNMPRRMVEWTELLQELRNSYTWTTHYGINESIRNYSFELLVWERLSQIKGFAHALIPIVRACALTYEQTPLLKGESRAEHFLRLSAIMGRVGLKDESSQWMQYGIRSSLIYGYHKDVTLYHLIDMVSLVGLTNRDKAMQFMAVLLPLVDLMPYLTTGKETSGLHTKAFEAVLLLDRSAAFNLLLHYARSVGKWKVQECLEAYITSSLDEDPYLLWGLTETVANHSSDYTGQMLKTRSHILEMTEVINDKTKHAAFTERYRRFVMTEISPRFWPVDLKEASGYDINMDEEPDSIYRGSEQYLLDGQKYTVQELLELCTGSFDVFCSVVERLNQENSYFYAPKLMNQFLRQYIARASTSTELVRTLEFIKSQRNSPEPTIMKELGQCFVALGDYNNAISSFVLAYHEFLRISHWPATNRYLADIAAIDQQRAAHVLLEACYRSTIGSQGGFTTPAIAAAGLFDLLKENELENVVKEFLTHCASMFAQLPKRYDYSWLYQSNTCTDSEDQSTCFEAKAIEFVFQELDNSEVDLGEKLVRSLVILAIQRPEITLLPLLGRLPEASGRLLRRLLTIIYCVVEEESGIMEPHVELLADLLERDHFLCRIIAMRMLEGLNKKHPLDDKVTEKLIRIEQMYTSGTKYSSLVEAELNADYFEFFDQCVPDFFMRQVAVAEQILEVEPGFLMAAVQYKLMEQEWSIEPEKEQLEQDYGGHVHPQGWPIVMFTTTFFERFMDLLWECVDEVTRMLWLSSNQVDALWHLFQLADPSTAKIGKMLRPGDIKPLIVTDKEEWLKELDMVPAFQTDEPVGDWITVCEWRHLAQDEFNNVPYKQHVIVQAYLVPQLVYGNASAIEEVDHFTEKIGWHTEVSVTETQTAEILQTRGQSRRLLNRESLPLLSVQHNSPFFAGHSIVCSLASFIVQDFKLVFDGLNLLQEDKLVAQYEEWQEGYQDESYSREKLSYGTRLKVHRDLLTAICQRYRKLLCVHIDQEREFYCSIHKRTPDEASRSSQYILYHI
ncbi:AAA family ATPase [Paenibacillus protaetiae]|uniref:AAA family ATPase n=1 Tax=Paenibacillus protaetiae TaxID=2509456 RepID=UPI001FC93359|nr:AAA family ATPase [Paenibacillus protaetiae]